MTEPIPENAPAGGADVRRHPRDSLFVVTELRLGQDGAPYRVKLRNVSNSGTMAEGAMRVTRGESALIDLPGVGWVAGVVAWAAGDRCGIAFEADINSTEVQFPVENVDAPPVSVDPVGVDVRR